MALQSKYIWMNGELVEFEKATVHFLTPALHHGIGAFEGIQCYSTDDGPAVFRLQDHVERLFNSARVLGLREIDFRVIGSGKTGPITREIQHQFHAAVRGKHRRSKEWLDYLTAPASVSLTEAATA
jgi:branched-subunit amino acid aminotransferase/4-amino-4-deoxychorismate lyase